MTTIKDYKLYYQADTFGNIWSMRADKILKSCNNGGYIYFSSSINGKKKNIFVHRLVAETFIPNPENKPQVNHIDGNPLNNNVNNLEWCTTSENMLHSFMTLGRKPNLPMIGKFGKDNSRSKIVYQYTLDDKLINKHYGISEAERYTKINFKNISSVCLGKRKSAGGYKWSYEEYL